jgi:cytochrome c
MRPLARYFGGNTDIPALAEYLQAALSTGNTLYMPTIPLQDHEAEALATYIAHLADPQAAKAWIAQRARRALRAEAPATSPKAEGAAR